jgi:GTP cyclohydrolase IA
MTESDAIDDRSESPSSSVNGNGEKRPRAKKSRDGKRRRNHGSAAVDGDEAKTRDEAGNADGGSAERRNSYVARRSSLSKPGRDQRDEPKTKRRRKHRRSTAATEEAVEEEPEALANKDKDDAEPSTRSASPVIDFDGLSRPSVGTRERLEESEEKKAERLERMQGAVATLLECVGENPARPGLVDTPRRYAKALLEFTQGYQDNVKDIVNGAIFEEGHNEMVVIKGIDIQSLCEHHLVPFTGKMHIGYIPNNAVIGLSKLPRIADMFARRLQIQERLTRDVANAIFEVLQPQGVAVVMESAHLCMVMRGVQKVSSTTITSCVLGCFERREKTRNEFLSLIGLNRH